MTYAVPACLPGYVGTAILALACSRRVPALRPVVAVFAAWSPLDAVTGPLWLRAGVCVAWPGAAVVAGLWGLKDEGPGSEPPSPHPACWPRVIRALGARLWCPLHRDQRSQRRDSILPLVIAAVYLLAGCVAALCYALGHRQAYHLALPLSRLATLPAAALVLLARPWRLPWAALACVVPLLGLAAGVALGVWTLLPAGLGVVREQWARLAGGETRATMGAVAVCCVGAWLEANAAAEGGHQRP